MILEIIRFEEGRISSMAIQEYDEQFDMIVKKYSLGVLGVVERNGHCYHMILSGFRKYSAYLLVVVVFGWGHYIVLQCFIIDIST